MFNVSPLSRSASLASLILRLALGVIFIAHGSQKLLGWFGGHGYADTMSMFTQQMGVPAFFAFLAIITEFFGGIALLVGLLTRLASLGIAVVMLVAMKMVHLQNGFFLASAPGQSNGIEYNIALLAMALALVAQGAGLYSLDTLFARFFKKSEAERETIDTYRPAGVTSH